MNPASCCKTSAFFALCKNDTLPLPVFEVQTIAALGWVCRAELFSDCIVRTQRSNNLDVCVLALEPCQNQRR